jgi:hypothetical protein
MNKPYCQAGNFYKIEKLLNPNSPFKEQVGKLIKFLSFDKNNNEQEIWMCQFSDGFCRAAYVNYRYNFIRAGEAKDIDLAFKGYLTFKEKEQYV